MHFLKLDQAGDVYEIALKVDDLNNDDRVWIKAHYEGLVFVNSRSIQVSICLTCCVYFSIVTH